MGVVPHRIPPGRIRRTYEDYLDLPEDGRRYEIIDGELVVTPAPTTTHQRVSVALVRLLGDYVAEHSLGELFHAPIDVILDETSIVQPDLAFVAASRREIVKERGIEGAPDLVVEILSKSTSRRDRTTKAGLYARYGVSHYWLVDPDERTFETYERGKRRYRRTGRHAADSTVRAPPFSGLTIELSDLWR